MWHVFFVDVYMLLSYKYVKFAIGRLLQSFLHHTETDNF